MDVRRLSDDYTLEEELGHGAYATVWMARHNLTQVLVAIKAIGKERLPSDEGRTQIITEVDFLKTVHHPHIAAFYDFFEDATNFYIVMELGEKGSLLEIILASRVISEASASRYLRQIVSGLKYLHETCHIAHRDLKCENLLLDKHNNILIIDFGLSHSLNTILQSKCGTPQYLAPELVHGGPYTESIDIWSTGIILYTMVAGKLPFLNDSMDLMMREILYADPVFPEHFSADLSDLLSKMLQKDPAHRITLSAIAAHPFVGRDTAEPCDPLVLHRRTLDRLKDIGISEALDIEETTPYRIVHRFIETESKPGLPPLPTHWVIVAKRSSGCAPKRDHSFLPASGFFTGRPMAPTLEPKRVDLGKNRLMMTPALQNMANMGLARRRPRATF